MNLADPFAPITTEHLAALVDQHIEEVAIIYACSTPRPQLPVRRFQTPRCDKKPYDSAAAANTAINSRQHAGSARLREYYCAFCRAHHLTHMVVFSTPWNR